MANAKKNSPKPFKATITPATIEKGYTARGIRYTTMKGATVKQGHRTDTRTVMAFGRDNAAVARSLKAGKPIDVLCRWEGGCVRIVGRQEKVAKAA